ncbi:hypothetical protein [Chryseobacterium oncorhynchi]|uniref:Lipoprotein n=1 Tax=Chryseobacterium oncorhynchi TaxID=741074 RepID=A0A316X536_9FLAO|nr:hypothetical protein [Chryseobacterium oncorhynchi]PWN65880.1 hypothetical protein C1638_005705 [Chryseobacterium oncorhynchi]
MKIFIYLISFVITSCSNIKENELYGKYIPISYHNTYDTLVIKKNKEYERRVYNHNKKLLLDYKSTFQLESLGSIKFDNFYLNLDRDLVKMPEDVKDTDMSMTTNFEKKDKDIIICFGYHEGENCYKKILE